MHWADKVVNDIIASGKTEPFWVDDMKTPSGYAHVGSLRGPLIHSVLYRALKRNGQEAKFTFIFNDFDPADEFPSEFKVQLREYAGYALKMVPSPDKNFSNLADLLAADLKKVMQDLGCEAEYLSSWEMYKAGKFDEVIKQALDSGEIIQDIYQKVSGSQKRQQNWLPFQVVCEKCHKLGTTKVFAWDGKEVSYRCEPDMVTWAKGCGHEGKISPFGGTGKLPWKVDWAAHWKVIGVTVEGAGKDHASAGGSYDIAMEICDKVFHYERPYKLPYEFFLIGGKKMSSSKGLGLKAHDITKFLPPELARFVFTRTNYKEQIEFNPQDSMAIPDLFDEYDKAWQSYNTGSDEILSRAFELSQIDKVPEKNKKLILPRFRDVANYLQLPSDVSLENRFAEVSKTILDERIKYAKYWLENFAPDEFKIEIMDKADLTKLDDEQITYLKEVLKLVDKETDPEKLQLALYEKSKEMKLEPKKAFSSIYLALLGRDHGPKAGWFLLEYKHGIIRLKEALQ
jgi:lysyl-tRNA synthetase, class I